jgi:hypothetical protein
MTAITQTIPTYYGGISEQPDFLKLPGQVKVAQNVYPDITYGLMKRPGSKLLSVLDDDPSDSTWFHYYRDGDEQYIGRINESDGDVKIWSCKDGSEKSVIMDDGASDYLKHSTNNDLATLTINDSTFIANRTTAVKMASTVEPARTPEAFIELKRVSHGRQYTLYAYDESEEVEVTTATRIEVERIVDSSNACSAAGAWVDSDDAGTTEEMRDRNIWSGSGYSGWDGTSSSPDDDDIAAGRRQSDYPSGSVAYTSKCTQEDVRDGTCVNNNNFVVYKNNPTDTYPVFRPRNGEEDTVIFTGNESTDIKTKDEGSYTVNAREGTNQTSYEIPRDLVFRINTIGQATPVAGGNNNNDPAVDYYTSRYVTTHDLLNGGLGWKEGDWFNVYEKYTWYRVTVKEISTSKIQANLSNIKGDGVIAPKPTSFDANTATTASSILGELRRELIATDAFTNSRVQIIGNGIYIKRVLLQDVTKTAGDPDYDSFGTFNMSTPNYELMNVFTDRINDVGELPKECKHGYILQITPSSSTDVQDDSYYVKFIGQNDLDGEGIWEECPEPGIETEIDKTTMPIQIIRQENGTFKVSFIDWDKRLVGNEETNPAPSFVSTDTVDKFVSGLMFYKNRLAILSGSTVVLSRPNSLFNFWAKTALTITDEDAIDVECNSTYPVNIQYGIEMPNGLLLFTENQQFIFSTDDAILSPKTARINLLAHYSCSTKTPPVDLGNTVAFLDTIGANSRFYEIINLPKNGQPEILEQSKIIPETLPQNLNIICNSVDNGIVLMAVKGSDTLYGFRYMNTGNDSRPIQAWFTWTLSGKIDHAFVFHDSLYAVVNYTDIGDVLQKFELRLNDDFVTQDSINYRVHLDNYSTIDSSALTYSKDTDLTTFTLPTGYHASNDYSAAIYIADEDSGNDRGKYSTVTLTSNTTGSIKGDWSTSSTYKLTLGYLFDMDVELPQIYVSTATGPQSYKTDQRSSLVVHRVKFNFGDSGVFETTLQRPGKDNYTELYESLVHDSSNTNTVAFDDEQSQTIPIYEKNTNVTLNLKSSHPSPATLHSMSWEGDYNSKYYRNV